MINRNSKLLMKHYLKEEKNVKYWMEYFKSIVDNDKYINKIIK